MKANNGVPDGDNASLMGPLENLKQTVKADMDISLIELLFHVNFDYSEKSGCHISCMMELQILKK